MPRLGSESTASARRHNPTQTHSSYYPVNSQSWHTRSPRSDSPLRSDSPSGHLSDSFDSSDDLLGPTRPSGSRSRWRSSGTPYGPRPLAKLSLPEQAHLHAAATPTATSSEPSSDAHAGSTTLEQPATGRAVVDAAEGGEQEDDEDDGTGAPQDESESELDEADHAHAHPQQPLSAAAAKKREKNKKKKAKARAKAKEKEKVRLAPDTIPPPPAPPQELLASMSRIATLVGSLDPDAPQDKPNKLMQQVHDALAKDGHSVPLAQWRAEVLQSVRRMETMLGKMEKWQGQVTPSEIEALKQETARLEGAVDVYQVASGKEKGKMEVRVKVVGARQSSDDADVVALQPGANEQDSDDADKSNSCPSDSDTDRSPQEEKSLALDLPPSPADSTQVPPVLDLDRRSPPSPPTHSHVTSLAPQDYNVPPEPPQDPVEYLKKYPWSMIEVMLLLEVTAHFPPAEHGWLFIAEAYNNLLITRPLQEWFLKQSGVTHEEDTKMAALLKRLGAEASQLRTASILTPAKATNVTPAPKATAAKAQSKAGERGKAAPFGSAEARAEANARAKPAPPPAAIGSGTAKGAHFVTRLPHPLAPLHLGDDQAGPPPAQRIMSLPRRRPPLTMPSADAKALYRIMRSAASPAGSRTYRDESRLAMLALFGSTGNRFVVRTMWDCWHRWHTPWIVQGGPIEEAGMPTTPAVPADYLAGNILVPFRTSIPRMPSFEYRPVPGTYPDVPGVQHAVPSTYDPRPGMVVYARTALAMAEGAWAKAGLGRAPDGTIADDIADARKVRPPTTLAGIWPGKGQPLQKAPQPAASSAASSATATAVGTAARPTPSSSPSPSAAATPPAKAANPPLPLGANVAAKAVNPLLPPGANVAATLAAPRPRAGAAVSTAQNTVVLNPPIIAKPTTTNLPPPPAQRSASSSPAPSTSTSPASAVPTPTPPPPTRAASPAPPQARPMQTTQGTIAKPVYPFYPLPEPRKPLSRGPPCVPEGTLGSTVRPGLSAWFEHAAITLDVLQRVAEPEKYRARFDVGLLGKEAVGKRGKENTMVGELETEEDKRRGVWVPYHLRKMAPPPPQRPPVLLSSSTTINLADKAFEA
ncbi:hypothetical protein C8Q76DRAFT_821373 [Earliella scabrosa]|nr:hypothetical protein C8Q76DRAFT_821373 [Earliella scabrosa]